MLNLENYSFNPFQENTYLIWDDTREGVVIDPGCSNEKELQTLRDAISRNQVSLKAIWLTHGHFDHVYGVAALQKEYGVQVCLSEKDQAILDPLCGQAEAFGIPKPDTSFTSVDIAGGDTLEFGHTRFSVIQTPGHTPGGVCLYDQADKVLFSGDTLFAGAIGRSDLYMGDYDKLIVSVMDSVMGIDGDVRVYPGHGPSTDIAYERTHNPFLQPFNESVDEMEMDWDEDGLEIHG